MIQEDLPLPNILKITIVLGNQYVVTTAHDRKLQTVTTSDHSFCKTQSQGTGRKKDAAVKPHAIWDMLPHIFLPFQKKIYNLCPLPPTKSYSSTNHWHSINCIQNSGTKDIWEASTPVDQPFFTKQDIDWEGPVWLPLKKKSNIYIEDNFIKSLVVTYICILSYEY